MAVEKIIGKWSPENVILGQLIDLVQYATQVALGEQNIVPWLKETILSDPKYGKYLRNYEVTSEAVDALVMGLGHALKDDDIKGIGSYASLYRGLHLTRGAIITPLLPHSSPSNPAGGSNPISPSNAPIVSPLGLGSKPAIY